MVGGAEEKGLKKSVIRDKKGRNRATNKEKKQK